MPASTDEQRAAKKEAVAFNEEERGGGKMTGCAKRKAKPAQVSGTNFLFAFASFLFAAFELN